MRAIPLLLLLLAACGPRDADLASIPVESAWLNGWDPEFVAILIGAGGDTAALNVRDPDGDVWTCPVSLRGGRFGVMLDISADIGPAPSDVFDLPDRPITAEDLLGTYDGSAGSFVIAFGISGRELKNGSGVRFAEDHLAAGFGMMGAFEWLVLKRRGPVVLSEQGAHEEDTGG